MSIIPADYSTSNYVGIEEETFEELIATVNTLTAGASPLWQFDGAFFVNPNGTFFAMLRRISPLGIL